MGETSPIELETGDILDGRYRILDKIGAGGFGAVYMGEQVSSGQAVAIKVLLPERLESTGKATLEIARFAREMKIIGKLKHPNIVRLLDTGKLADDSGGIYIVLDFIEGESLSGHTEKHGPLSLRQTKRLMTQVCDALCTAHELGVVHRDLKPQNIMLTDTGGRLNATVLDFGIASVVKDQRDKDFRTLTSQGEFRGTPAYMAPEQFSGTEELTPQSDVYAWGLVFVECLTGKLTIDGDSAFSIMYQQMSEAPVPIPAGLLGHPIGEILQRALAKPLDERYATSNALLAALGNCELGGFEPTDLTPSVARLPAASAEPSESEAQPTPVEVSGGAPTKPTLIIAGVVVAALVVGAVVLFSGGGDPTSDATHSAATTQAVAPTTEPPEADVSAATSAANGDVVSDAGEEPAPAMPETVLVPAAKGVPLGLEPDEAKAFEELYAEHKGFAFELAPDTGVMSRESYDRPALEVTRTEITWADWAARPDASLAADVACGGPLPAPLGEDFAVTMVGAAEADAFCKALGMRLPTYREWEAIARGAQGRQFAIEGELTDARLQELLAKAPVGKVAWSTTPSGVVDMTGGVYEWVRCEPPEIVTESGKKVRMLSFCAGDGFGFRGGSWKGPRNKLHTWLMGYSEKADSGFSCVRRDDIGFRCVTEGE